MLDYATSMSGTQTIALDDLPELHVVHPPPRAPSSPSQPANAQAQALLQALRQAHWNVSDVARQMGLARMTLYRRMKRAGIVPPNRA